MRPPVLLCLITLSARLAGAATVPGDGGQRLALMPMQGDLEARVSKEFDGLLRAEVSRVGIYAVVDVDTTRKELTTARQLGLRCDAKDLICAAKVGAMLRADLVLVPSGTPAPDGVELQLTVVDVANATRLNSTRQVVALEGPVRLTQLREAVELLLVPERRLGSLRVTVAQAGALVMVDGAAVGTSPLPGDVGELAPGPHVVALRLAGHQPFQAEVSIEPGQVALLEAQLQSLEARAAVADAEAGPGLVHVGIAAAIVGGTVALLAGGGTIYSALKLNPDNLERADRIEDILLFGRVLLGVTVVGGLVTAAGGVAAGLGLAE